MPFQVSESYSRNNCTGLKRAIITGNTCIQYMYIVGKYEIYLNKFLKQVEMPAFVELFWPVSQKVEINCIFTDNVHVYIVFIL